MIKCTSVILHKLCPQKFHTVETFLEDMAGCTKFRWTRFKPYRLFCEIFHIVQTFLWGVLHCIIVPVKRVQISKCGTLQHFLVTGVTLYNRGHCIKFPVTICRLYKTCFDTSQIGTSPILQAVQHFLLHLLCCTIFLFTCVQWAACHTLQQTLTRVQLDTCGTPQSRLGHVCSTPPVMPNKCFSDTCPSGNLSQCTTYISTRGYDYTWLCVNVVMCTRRTPTQTFVRTRVHIATSYGLQKVLWNESSVSRVIVYTILLRQVAKLTGLWLYSFSCTSSFFGCHTVHCFDIRAALTLCTIRNVFLLCTASESDWFFPTAIYGIV